MNLTLTASQMHLRHALMGLLMGAALSYIGFADYGEVHKMFTFTDLRLLFTFAGAVALAFVGFLVIGQGRYMPRKTLHPGIIPGSVLFGAGWAMTGACPSIALVQFGQGYLPAVFTILGLLFGAWAYRGIHRRFFRWDTGSCG